jgi:hypothetical protein
MYQNSDWIKAISRLSRLTVEGALSWKPASLEDEELPDAYDQLVRAFSCEHKERRYEVFEVRSRHYTDEDTYSLYSQHYLNIYKRTRPLYFDFITRSPPLPVVGDLFRTVERAYAHQEGALDDLLSGASEAGEE